MNVTSTGIGVAIAVVVALAFLFFGPRVLTPFGVQAPATASSSADMQLPANTNVSGAGVGEAPGLPAQQANQAAQAQPTQTQPNQPQINMNDLPTQLSYKDDVVGTGAEAKAGDTVTVTYVGSLPDGTVFDASKNHGDGTFTFKLGAGMVIKGWDEGVAGMKIGGTRTLIVPPADGYGNQQVGSIPANSTLIFQIELLKVS